MPPRTILRGLLLAMATLLVVTPAWGQTDPCLGKTLCLPNLTAPNIIGDSNLNGQPDDGPRVFTISARACNNGVNDLKDLYVYVGDGTTLTPGSFPIADVSGLTPTPLPYADEGYHLELLPGDTGVRFEGKRRLAPGECAAFYFPVKYPVVDSAGNALWGLTRYDTDDLPFEFSIWGSATDAVTLVTVNDQLDVTTTIRNEITASPNKVQPNPAGQTYYDLNPPPAPAAVDTFDPTTLPVLDGPPPPIAPGETITIYFANPTFGNPNQGFDVDGDTFPDEDLWFQPLGEEYFYPDVFRLVKVQGHVVGNNCNGPESVSKEVHLYLDDTSNVRVTDKSNPGGTDIHQERKWNVWYLKNINDQQTVSDAKWKCKAWDAQWYSYTFLALQQGKSRIAPYQEVASGSDNEKYNGDYCGDLFSAGPDLDTPHPICVPLRSHGTPEITLDKTVDLTFASAGNTLTYTITFTNVGSVPIGSKDYGIQIRDAIPANTTFTGVPTCSLANCDVAYSNGGDYKENVADVGGAAAVTDLRWSLNDALAPAASGTVTFSVIIDNPYPPGTGIITNVARLGIDNSPDLITDDAETAIGMGIVTLHLFVDDGPTNGSQDPGEWDLPNVDVTITRCTEPTVTVTSNATGDVSAIVPAGCSANFDVVEATLPPGYAITIPPGNQEPQNVVGVAGVTVPGIDIGYVPPGPTGSIGDFVWEDLDGDGVQDGGEPGLPGVTVQITGPGCAPCTDTTDGGGFYDVTGLVPGTYTVTITGGVPPGSFLTTGNAPLVVSLLPGQDYNDADFGYEPPVGGVIGDFVWADDPAQTAGVYDPGESGIPNVEVELQSAGCTPSVDCPTQFTGADGDYLFTDLAADTYTVVVLGPPPGATPSYTPPMPIVLGPSKINLDADFGYGNIARALVGDYVWHDLDGDGIMDPGEPGIPGVVVELQYVEVTWGGGPACTLGVDCAFCDPLVPGEECPTATTDATGWYRLPEPAFDITDLPPGQYRAVVTPPGAPWIATTPDSVAVPVAGLDFLDADFGFRDPTVLGSIGDLVWNDLNGDGTWQAGEPGIDGVTVELQSAACTPSVDCPTAVTAGGGAYLFPNLPAASYTVDVWDATLPPGMVLTTPPEPLVVNLAAAENYLTADFGYWTPPLGSIGDLVWDDLNGDGAWQAGEPGIDGVTVNLTGPGCAPCTAVTAGGGAYLFNNLPPGSYTVDVVDATVPAGYVLTTANDPLVVNLLTGQNYLTADFGYWQPGSIGDFIWDDLNDDGAWQAGEPGIDGVTVELQDGVCTPGATCPTMVTAGGGAYLFTGLAAGNYTVDVIDATVPAGYVLTTANDPLAVVLSAGENYLTADFGYWQPGSIGDFIWDDLNGDGAWQAGEPGIDGVTIELQYGVCTPGVDCPTMVTAGGGAYLFPNLPPGNYTVDVVDATVPAGMVSTTANDPLAVVLTAGQNYLTADFGYWIPSAPAIAIVKTPATQTVLSGGTASFTLTVTNPGNVDLSNVVVTDPECTTPVVGPTGDDGDNVLQTTETWVFTCTTTNVTAGFTNTVSVTGDPPSGPPVTDNDTADVTVDAPAIAIVKTPATQTVAPGGTASFTLTVTNPGNVDLSNVVVTDPECTTPVVGPTGDAGDAVLQTTETWVYTCTTTNVTADFTNTVSVTGDPPLGPPVTDNDTSTVTVTALPPVIDAVKTSTLVVDNDGNGALDPGDNLQYTIDITNTGAGDATAVVFDDTPDVNTTLVVGTVMTTLGSVITGNTAGDTSVTIDIGTLVSGGGSVTVTFEVRINDPLPSDVTEVVNQGTVSGGNFPDVPTDDPNTGPLDDPVVDIIGGRQIVHIPTLSQWGLLLFVLLLATAAAWAMRRARETA